MHGRAAQIAQRCIAMITYHPPGAADRRRIREVMTRQFGLAVDAVKHLSGERFAAHVHETIDRARRPPETPSVDRCAQNTVHALRVDAEAGIPKPVMKRYKALLREGLFG